MTQTITAKAAASTAENSAAYRPVRHFPQRAIATAKTLATLLLLFLVLPLNLTLVLLALLSQLSNTLLLPFRSRSAAGQAIRPKAVPKTVLISGGKMTKALQLARSFHTAGHRVILIETHKYWLIGHRFSNAVDKFYTVPAVASSDYAQALLDIVQREAVDTYVPVCSPAASYYDAQAMPLLLPHCDVLHIHPSRIEQLDDKYQFAKAAESLGLAVPKSYRITDPQQVIDFDFSGESRKYILKSIPYDSVRRLDLTRLPCETPEATADFVRSLPISQSKPWIMQEFIPGQEYCTHSTLRDGGLRMHCCCKSSAFQVNYQNVDRQNVDRQNVDRQNVDRPATANGVSQAVPHVISQWITKFAAGLSLTGQASFDFIEAADTGEVYAIECNPRTHSAITMFYNQPAVAQAYLEKTPLPAPVEPKSDSRPTYWIYHEVWRLLTHLHRPKATMHRLETIAEGKDAIFDWRDPLPFLMVHHWQIPLLLLRDLRAQSGWIRIDFNIGKLVQLGGD